MFDLSIIIYFDSMKQLFKYAKMTPHPSFQNKLEQQPRVLKWKDKICPHVMRATIRISVKHNSTINV